MRAQIDPLVEHFNQVVNAEDSTDDQRDEAFSNLLSEVLLLGMKHGGKAMMEAIRPILEDQGIRIAMFNDKAEADLFADSQGTGGDVLTFSDGQLMQVNSIEADKRRLL